MITILLTCLLVAGQSPTQMPPQVRDGWTITKIVGRAPDSVVSIGSVVPAVIVDPTLLCAMTNGGYGRCLSPAPAPPPSPAARADITMQRILKVDEIVEVPKECTLQIKEKE